jgi:hypothetical protein
MFHTGIIARQMRRGKSPPAGALRCALPPLRGSAPQRPAGGPKAPRTTRQ